MAIEFYSSIDVNQNDIHTPVIHKLSSAPSSPSPISGQMYYNTTANTLHYHDGSNFIQVANHADIGSSGMTAFIIEDDDGTEVSISNAEEIKFIGSGLTTNFTDTSTGSDGDPFDLTFTIDAAQTGITSILATDLKIGEDDQTKIDFETADTINFYAGNEKQLVLTDGALTPGTNAILDLGTDALEFKDGYFDGTLEADAITIGGTNIVSGSLITTLGTISAGVWNGTAIASAYLDADTAHLSGAQTVTGVKTISDDVKLQFRDSGLYLNSSSDGQLDIDADTTLEITAPTTNISASTTVDITSPEVQIISSTSAKPVLTLHNSNADATSAELKFNKDSSSGADNDVLGKISFYGTDAAENTEQELAYIDAIMTDSAHGSEASSLRFYVAENDGTRTAGLTIVGQPDDDGEVDVTIGAGAGSTVTIPGNLTVTGTTTTNNVETVTTSSGVIFEGTAADGHDATLLSVVASSDKTYTLPNVTGHVALFAADPSTTTISSTPAELNKLDGATVTTAEINLIDGDTARGTTAVADGDGFLHNDGGTMRMTNVSKLADLFAGTNISASSSVLSVADGSASAKGVVELATAAEVITGTDTARVVTADTLSAKSVVCTIAQSSLTDDLRATITHDLGTADTIVQLFDMTTEAQIYAEIGRTTDDMSTASTSVITVDFGTSPPNDVRAVITSLAGATAGSIAYT